MRLTLASCLILTCLSAASAGDWPQILGPDRNATATGEKLAETWPADGPKELWSMKVGDGFSGVAVKGGKAILFHRIGDEEVAECLDPETGKPIWKTAFPTAYVPSFTSDRGPRAVPLIDGDHVYLYGARGGLHSVKLADGEKVWSRDIYEDYSSKRPSRGEPAEGYFGYGTTPIVEGDLLLLNAGGYSKEAGIVAFNKLTGKTVWAKTEEKATYSSPVAATFGGQRHVIFATRLNVVSVDPKNGRVLFEFPFGELGPAATGATPVVFDDLVFITGSYNFGAILARVGRTGSIPVWSSDEVLSSQYTTSILHEGAMFGVHGRQDSSPASLRCIDPKTKTIHWEERDFGYATFIKADGKLLIIKTNGEAVLAKLSTKMFEPIASASLFIDATRPTTRALPALSNGRLFVRDERTLKCVSVGR
ncbi:MAG: PQQ-like beta-propeller repeat protein [Planctomycetota bacterium]|nr:PQQ-like beta-propeller repeat protein [Planctomycetota bacterium]MDA1249182.1 PQQ-like beta-propeller repeat protein [Planctomycetota bacterium]